LFQSGQALGARSTSSRSGHLAGELIEHGWAHQHRLLFQKYWPGFCDLAVMRRASGARAADDAAGGERPTSARGRSASQRRPGSARNRVMNRVTLDFIRKSAVAVLHDQRQSAA
jgi:hypothetical protein